MKLYASGEDYLEAILVLKNKLGMVRSVDVARHMGVSKASVTHATTTLRKGGFLTMAKEHYIHLTNAGRVTAEKIYERHQFFTMKNQSYPFILCLFYFYLCPFFCSLMLKKAHRSFRNDTLPAFLP